MKSHIINGHYMYGNTFIQPDMPMYNHIHHHTKPHPGMYPPPMRPPEPCNHHPYYDHCDMAPVHRCIPPYPDMIHRPVYCPDGNDIGCCLGYEDSANRIDCPYTNPDDENNKCNCEDCPFSTNGIIRDPLVNNIINIETSVIKTLRITLYGTSRDLDKTIEMKTGSRYMVTYITEHGLVSSVGILEVISDAVPDTCTRYLNTVNMAAANTAYIGMDCSSVGHSDKRKIYIATIRNIRELDTDEEVDVEEYKSMRDKLNDLLDAIDRGELIFYNSCNESHDEDTSTDDDQTDDDTEFECPNPDCPNNENAEFIKNGDFENGSSFMWGSNYKRFSPADIKDDPLEEHGKCLYVSKRKNTRSAPMHPLPPYIKIGRNYNIAVDVMYTNSGYKELNFQLCIGTLKELDKYLRAEYTVPIDKWTTLYTKFALPEDEKIREPLFLSILTEDDDVYNDLGVDFYLDNATFSARPYEIPDNLIQNGTFEDDSAELLWHREDDSNTNISIVDDPLGINKKCLQISTTSSGIFPAAYYDLDLKPGKTYDISIDAMVDGDYYGTFQLGLMTGSGYVCSYNQYIPANEWKTLTVRFTVPKQDVVIEEYILLVGAQVTKTSLYIDNVSMVEVKDENEEEVIEPNPDNTEEDQTEETTPPSTEDGEDSKTDNEEEVTDPSIDSGSSENTDSETNKDIEDTVESINTDSTNTNNESTEII